MTNNEIKVACAEELGWHLNGRSLVSPQGRVLEARWMHEQNVLTLLDLAYLFPHFTGSLDAARLLLDAVKPEEQWFFASYLYHETTSPDEQLNDHFITWLIAWRLVTATPLQICRAFLKLRGKWRGE